ncbi:MAG: CBS domain-containing protein [Gammaproteobacteria bacterium]|nr:CBS domain-containing protein [Gammaproteobacteria bacterium]
MSEDVNLGLDIDELGLHGSGKYVARIAVQSATGFTRSGAAPTITEDCRSYESLAQEVARLKAELDAALERAAEHFETRRRERAEVREQQRGTDDGDRGEKAHLTSNLKVHEVMTRDVRTLHENDQLSMAEELMKIGRFRHVVVLDDDDKLSGVVSHRDIFYSTIAWSTGLGRYAHDKALQTFPVKQVMTNSPQTVAPDMELGEAASLMMTHKIGCLPVLDGDKLVGILTEGDFLALIV